MKSFHLVIPFVLASAWASYSQQSSASQDTDVQLIKKHMLEMQAAIQKMEVAHREELAALRAQIEAQQKSITEMQKAGAPPPLPSKTSDTTPTETPSSTTPPAPLPSNSPLFPTTDEALVPGSAAASTPQPGQSPAAAPGPAFPTTDEALTGTAAAPSSPAPASGPPPTISIGGGKAYMNISFDGLFIGAISTEKHLDRLEVGDHDPHQRGFNARNLELALDGAVDPYFQAFANIVFKLDNDNETEVEVEEAFMQTTTLPYALQLKGGQFFAPFGRINSQHPHGWDFADAPLTTGRLLGPDGLRGVGVQVSWVAPFTWFSQFTLAVQNGRGGTGYSFRNRGEDGTFYGRETLDRELRGVQDLAVIPRWESSLDLSPTQTVLVGVSGAFGPNDTGANERTQIYGVDLFYKWKAANAEGGWPFFKWQTEALFRRYEAGRGAADSFPVSETFRDWGIYSQGIWGFRKGWDVGLRGDYLHMQESNFTDDPERQSRWRLSAELTWYPSEFSKLRLQYNHDILEANAFLGSNSADSVFLQFEFGLGAHAAHKF